jgi:hypothetical protein
MCIVLSNVSMQILPWMPVALPVLEMNRASTVSELEDRLVQG